MRANDLADSAWEEMSGGDSEKSPFGSSSDDSSAEMEAHMRKFARAASAKDWAGMAKAFKGAMACESDSDSDNE